MQEKALVIEDDADLREFLRNELSGLGYEIETAGDGKSGLEYALASNYKFIVLDMVLPGLEGKEVCKKIREQNTTVPILMLTAKSDSISKILLLELGADDYLTKPFEIAELKARIGAVLRRSQVSPIDDSEARKPLTIGELQIDFERRKVVFKGANLELTVREFDFLELLSTRPGRPFSREQIAESIFDCRIDTFDRGINSLVARLRAKLSEDPEQPNYLRTVRGIGYRLCEAHEVE